MASVEVTFRTVIRHIQKYIGSWGYFSIQQWSINCQESPIRGKEKHLGGTWAIPQRRVGREHHPAELCSQSMLQMRSPTMMWLRCSSRLPLSNSSPALLLPPASDPALLPAMALLPAHDLRCTPWSLVRSQPQLPARRGDTDRLQFWVRQSIKSLWTLAYSILQMYLFKPPDRMFLGLLVLIPMSYFSLLKNFWYDFKKLLSTCTSHSLTVLCTEPERWRNWSTDQLGDHMVLSKLWDLWWLFGMVNSSGYVRWTRNYKDAAVSFFARTASFQFNRDHWIT